MDAQPADDRIRVAMLLAAGLGERLRPLTELLPKPLLPLLGRPIMAYLLDQLSDLGIERVVINAHHLGDLLRSYVGDGEAWGLKVSYSNEPDILGTAGGLKHAAAQLGDETFLTLNADILLTPQPAAWLRTHRSAGALATLVLRADPEAERYGSIGLRDNGRLGRFLTSMAPGDDAGSSLMFTGAAVMEPAFLDHVPAGRYCDISLETYPTLLREGFPLAGVRYEAYWLDLGAPQRYLQAHTDVLDGRAPGIVAPGSAVSAETLAAAGVRVQPPVWLAENCHVEAGAKLGPYAVLGKGCVVGAGASLARSVAWEGVRIGANAVVRDSILAHGVRLAAHAKVEREVLIAEECAS